MLEQFMPSKPKYLAKDLILNAELRERGSKCAFKRLVKEKKGTYPKTGAAADCSYWWGQFKKGKKKDKMAMMIMASQHDLLVEQLDRSESKVLEFEAKTKSQEKEIKLLQMKLQQQDIEKSQETSHVLQLEAKIKSQNKEIRLLEQNLQQWDKACNSQKEKITSLKQEKEIKLLQMKLQQQDIEKSQETSHVLQLEAKIKSQNKEIRLLEQNLQQRDEACNSQKEKITSLKQKIHKQEQDNEQLKEEIANHNTACDDFENSLRLPTPVIYPASRGRSLASLLNELPDLQNDNNNYEFRTKIKNWLLNGEVDPQAVCDLARMKCPPKAWQAIEKDFDNKDPATTGTQRLQKLWRRISEALGPGTNQFYRFYYHRQKEDERFEEYLQEKFRLYCAYGVENKKDPDRNDPLFICNAIEKAAKRYRKLATIYHKTYFELLRYVKLKDSMLMTAERNECLNCNRTGHTKAVCRRPGGDAEVGPNQCFTCGGHGHWARRCWTYQY